MHVIDERAFNLLQYIVTSRYSTVEKAVKSLNCTERQIYYDLTKINDLLAKRKVLPIRISKGRIVASQDIKHAIHDLDLSGRRFIVSGNSKIWLICIMIFCTGEPLGLNNFIYKFGASRNAILKDLKNLSSVAGQYDVMLQYTRKDGYHFSGAAKNIRTLVLIAISNLKDSYMCTDLIALAVGDKSFAQTYVSTEKLLKEFAGKQKLSLIREYLEPVAYFICLLSYHYQSAYYQPVIFQDHLWQHAEIPIEDRDGWKSLLPKR